VETTLQYFLGMCDGMKYSDKDINELKKELQMYKDDIIDIDGICCDDYCCYGDEE
jgi:hypothetical protein